MSEIDLRPLRVADVPAVLAVQAQCYEPQFLESAQAFEAKLKAVQAHDTCWIATAGDGQPLAYVLSLPACADSLPALDASSAELPVQPHLLYLHDLAVARRALDGTGGPAGGLDRATCQQLGLRQLGLVAVQGSVPFWRRHGFEPLSHLPKALAQKLASFGAEACFMQRVLS